jgi:hypothetical protein
MKIFLALAATAMVLLSPMPARAGTIYPKQPCRVFLDTDYTQIAGQCGASGRFYPRTLFVRARRCHFGGTYPNAEALEKVGAATKGFAELWVA